MIPLPSSADISWSLNEVYNVLQHHVPGKSTSKNVRFEIAFAVSVMLVLWAKSFIANRRECVERAFCQSNRDAADRGLWAWAVAELTRCDNVSTS